MVLHLLRQVPGVGLALMFLALIVAAQSAAFMSFIAGVETWIEPGLFSSLSEVVDWPLGLVLFAVLAFLFMKFKRHLGLIALAFLATGFVFGLEAFEWWGMV